MFPDFQDLIALIFLGVLLYSLVRAPFDIIRERKRAKKRTATASGTVLRTSVGKLQWGVNVPKPHVEFADAHGKTFEFHSRVGASWNPWPVGSRVVVGYDPDDPTNAELQDIWGAIWGTRNPTP